jgi:hypothetical protein
LTAAYLRFVPLHNNTYIPALGISAGSSLRLKREQDGILMGIRLPVEVDATPSLSLFPNRGIVAEFRQLLRYHWGQVAAKGRLVARGADKGTFG